MLLPGITSEDASLSRDRGGLNTWLILGIYSPQGLIPGDVTAVRNLFQVVSPVSQSRNFLRLRGGDVIFKTGLKTLTVRES